MQLFCKHETIAAWKVGLLQATIVIAYILTGASVMTSPLAGALHNSIIEYPPVSILAFLTTFVFSALFCSSAMLGYPALLCFEKKYLRAVHIVLWDIAWLAFFLLGIVLISAVNVMLRT